MNLRFSLPLVPLLTATAGALLMLLPIVAFAADNGPVSFVNTAAQKVVWTLVINLTGMLLGVGGAILDASINYFVIGFGSTFLNTGVGLAVNQTWVIIRDFVNLGFIFGLVYIGFKMILGNDTSNTRRWLVNLIIAALLVNFSLLMTKVVVDFSNELAAQIAVSALGAEEKDGKYTSKTTMNLMNVMGITSVFGVFKSGELPKGVAEGGGWGYIIGTGILFLVTAFVFGAGGILLIIRFIALNLYMMLSPLMFVGWVLPFLSDQMSKYWKGFLKRAFFAPIYLLFIYFGLQVLSGLRKSVTGFSNPDFSAALSGGGSGGLSPALTSGTTISFFLLACGFMMAALVIADRMGAEGASQSVKLGKDLMNRARRYAGRGVGAATFGASASLARNTVGRGANALAQNDKFKSYAARSTLGRGLYQTAKYGANVSFDARKVGGVGKSLGIGDGGKGGGYKKRLDDRVKADKAFLKDLGTADVDKPETKAEISALQQKITSEAQTLKTRAETERELFVTNLNNSADVFTATITSLANKISEKEQALAQKDRDGLLTENDKRQRQEEIGAMKADMQTMEAAKAAVGKSASLKEARDKAAAALATSTGSEVEKTRLRDAAEKAAAAYDQNLAAERTMFEARIKAEDERLKNAKTEAEASIKYANQLAYIEKLRRKSSRGASFTQIGAKTAGGVSGGTLAGVVVPSFFTAAAAGAATGGLALGYGAVAGAAGSAKTAQLKNSIEELEKEYGKNGTKKMKKDKQKKVIKDKLEAENELKDDDDKKDDKKDDDKEDKE